MSVKILFLAWQDKKWSRQWFPVGRLDADVEQSHYRFRYTSGVQPAIARSKASGDVAPVPARQGRESVLRS